MKTRWGGGEGRELEVASGLWKWVTVSEVVTGAVVGLNLRPRLEERRSDCPFGSGKDRHNMNQMGIVCRGFDRSG